MERHKSVKHLDITLNDSNLEEGVTQIIKCARPLWKGLSYQRKVLTGGYNNRLFAVFLEDSSNDKVIVRIYSEYSDNFIDRKKELETMVSLNKSGLIPPVYCSFNNGISYGYSPGNVLNKSHLKDPNISKLIAETFARMHTVVRENAQGHNEIPSQSFQSEALRRVLQLIPDNFFDENTELPLRKYWKNKESLESEITQLENCYKKFSSPLVLCHNDLFYANIVFDSEKNCVYFIDFEFSEYNFQSFDIGNHFNEFCGVDTFDPNLHPNKEFQIDWIRHYLKTYKTLKGETTLDDSLFEKQVEELFNEVQFGSMTAHLFWLLLSALYYKDYHIECDIFAYIEERIKVYFNYKNSLFKFN